MRIVPADHRRLAASANRRATVSFCRRSANIEDEQAEAAKPELKRHAAEIAAWEAERDGILQAIKQAGKTGKPIDRLRAELAQLEAEQAGAAAHAALALRRRNARSAGLESGAGWPSGGVVSSEAGLVFGAHGMGKDSIMRNLAMLNQLWDGNALHVDRRTSESLRGTRGTADRGAASAGADAAEFLRPIRRAGAWHRIPCPVSCGVAGIDARLSTVHRSPAELAAPGRIPSAHRRDSGNPVPIDEDGALTPPVLTLAPEAKAAWVAFHDAIESELASGGELYDVRDVASKTADNAARLAALFQIFEHGMGGAVGLECFEAASRIAAWHLNESRRFFGELALPAELANAVRLDDWLIEYCRRERTHLVPIAKLQQGGPGGLRSKATIEAAMRELDEAGRARLRHEGRRKWIAVNPALLATGATHEPCRPDPQT